MSASVDSMGASPGVAPGLTPLDSNSMDVAGKVRISVDDTSLLSSPTEPVRARSLNKLTSMEEELSSPDLYRCPSFPRLQRNASGCPCDSTNCSMTHLETNSISPRVSTDNLTNLTKDDYRSRDNLSLQDGYHGLVRSVSWRAVDELPPLEFPMYKYQAEASSKAPSASCPGKPPVVSRSTSCPSVSYIRRSPSPHQGGASAHCVQPGAAPANGVPPVSVVVSSPPAPDDDQDIKASCDKTPNHHPLVGGGDGQPESDTLEKQQRRQRDGQGPTPTGGLQHTPAASGEERPMHTKRLLEKQRERLVLIKHNYCASKAPPAKDPKETDSPATTKSGLNRGSSSSNKTGSAAPSGKRSDYLNIGDIPSSLAEKVMSDKNLFMSKKEITVQKKCLQWLNSLDIDNT